MWGCSLSSCNAGNCPQTYRAHRVSAGTSLMDHICQQWSYPLICSPIWRVSSISNPNWKGSSAASAERPGRKEYCHLKGDWKLAWKSTNLSDNHMVWLHSLKNPNNKRMTGPWWVEMGPNRKSVNSTLHALCWAIARDNRLAMSRVHSHAEPGQHC